MSQTHARHMFSDKPARSAMETDHNRILDGAIGDLTPAQERRAGLNMVGAGIRLDAPRGDIELVVKMLRDAT